MAKHFGQRWLINEELNLRNCFSALRVLIVGFFTAHFLSGPTPYFGELVDDSFTFSSLAQRQMFLKMQLTQNICVLDTVPTVCFPVLPFFCLVLFRN